MSEELAVKFTPELSKYFEHSGSDDKADYYDIKDPYVCWSNGGKHNVLVLSVDHNGTITHIHDEERGELEASPGGELTIYRMSLKEIATFR